MTRYQPPAPYFMWPLKPGDTWAQEFQYTDGRNDGRYANTWKVGTGLEPIDTVAGRFYTLRVERWSGSQRLEAYWYSPRVRYWVRHEDYLRGYQEELVESWSWSGRGGREGRSRVGPLPPLAVLLLMAAGLPSRPPGRGAPLAREQPQGVPRGARAGGRPRGAGRPPDPRRRGHRPARPDPRADDDGAGRGARPRLGRPRRVTVRGTAAERVPRLAEVLALLRPSPVGLLLEIKTGPGGVRYPASRSGSWRSWRPRASPTGRP